MKKIFFFCLTLIWISSRAQIKDFDFYFSYTSYIDTVSIRKYIYNSYSGELLNKNQKLIIKINKKDKRSIYNYYKRLSLKNASYCMKYEDNTSFKISFILKKTDIKNKKCNTNKEDLDKYLGLYTTIRTILHAKEEYQDSLGEFEE